jgi:hypothetical protein
VQTRDGHVCENYVFCDDPFFARVAAELATLKAFLAHDPGPKGRVSVSGQRFSLATNTERVCAAITGKQ